MKTFIISLCLALGLGLWTGLARSSEPDDLFVAGAKGGVDLIAVQVFLGDSTNFAATNEITNPVEGNIYFLWLVWDVVTPTDAMYQIKALIRDLNTGSTVTGCTDVLNTGAGRFQYLCPQWLAVEGNYRFEGELDEPGQVSETSENNNSFEMEFTVAPRAGGIQCLSDFAKADYARASAGGIKGVAPDAFEPDGTPGLASPISVGEFENLTFRYPQRHNFHQTNDHDWVRFHSEFDTRRGDFLTYVIQALNPGSQADVSFELYDAAGNLETSFGNQGLWDGAGPGQEETVPLWKPDEEKVYYLCARQSDGSVAGGGTQYDVDVSIIEPDGGRIAGVVTDAQNGSGIELALFQTDPPTSFRWSTADGEYAMVNLGPGFYDLQVDAMGYETRLITNIEVVLGEETRVNLTLPPRSQSAFNVAAAQSGSYFDSSHNGEGWLLEILSLPTLKDDGSKGAPGLALAYWFTYPGLQLAKGQVADQAWLVGVGEVEDDVITFRNVIAPRGGGFGPGFDPANVTRGIWGDFEFRFNGCNSGTMSYIGPPGFGAGNLNLERITGLAGQSCGAGKGMSVQAIKVSSIGPEISGSWFDPSHDGEGWLIEILSDDLALVYWFSYDADGNPAWWVGVGTINGKTITIEEAELPAGTVFGSNFDADDINHLPWGQMVFTFDSCTSGTMSYQSAIGEFGSGTLDLRRITSIPGLGCN